MTHGEVTVKITLTSYMLRPTLQLTVNPSWCYVIQILTLKILQSADTVYVCFCLDLKTNSRYFPPKKLFVY